MDNIKRLAEILAGGNIVFFGGAGVSTESGIPDFRSDTGIYAAKEVYGRRPEDLVSRTCLVGEPGLFFRYYRERFAARRDAEPNNAHKALAELERRGLLDAVITQNTDGLHQKAGSKKVLELHGSNERQYCSDCKLPYSLEFVMGFDGEIPRCGKCGGVVRPDVVLYEEGLDDTVVSEAVSFIRGAKTLIIGGTSLAVQPAAGLLRYFKGSNLVLINKSRTPYDSEANLVINEPIGEVLAAAMSKLGE